VAAKSGYFQPNILSKEEIEKFDINFEKLRDIRLGAATERGNTLVLVIKIPTKTLRVDRKLITPVPNKTYYQLNTPLETVILINQTHYTHIAGKSWYELRKSRNCVFLGKCALVRNTQQTVSELDDHMLLVINGKNLTLKSTCDNRKILMSGHFFITYYNCTIKVGNETFQNKIFKTDQKYVLPPIPRAIEVENLPTFDEIVLNQKQNIQRIKELHFHRVAAITLGSFSVSSILILAVIVIFLCRRQERIKLNIKTSTEHRRERSFGSIKKRYPPKGEVEQAEDLV